ncbi:MAG: class I SAM-dependent rRNA methyltransferase [Bdellovibrionia bacterium]
MVPVVWKLRPGAERRIKSGHPWVFSNELAASPKGHPLGAPVELHDSRGQFLARGYGNPHSLIAFRALSFQSQERKPWGQEFLHDKMLVAWSLRQDSGFKGSFRLCFGESDYLPGIVCDYYLVEQFEIKYQVFCVQIVTAGMEFILNDMPHFFKHLVSKAQEQGLTSLGWEQTAVVMRNDVQVRKLEGLPIPEPQVIKEVEGLNLREIDILLNSAQEDDFIKMQCDLVEGQKTGFFLDQTHNIFLVTSLLKKRKFDKSKGPVRILDLCCYVGHWSTQLTRLLVSMGLKVEVTQLDVSESALNAARKNAEREGAHVVSLKADVLEKTKELPSAHYDIVISDPPAFIKAKKDIHVGKHAYLKMNTEAFRVAKKHGYVVSCSCSGLLEEEEFRDVLRKAGQRSGAELRSILRGGHAADHPTLMQFPEGFYLKMYTHYLP